MVSTYAELSNAVALQQNPIIIDTSFAFLGTLTIGYSVTIQGVDPFITLTRSGGVTGSFFNVNPSGDLNLKDLTFDGGGVEAAPILSVFGALTAESIQIQNGISTVAGAIIIESNATASFNQVIITNCSGTTFNGPVLIQSFASLAMTNSSLQNNTATAGNGGAVFVNSNGTLQCTNVQFLQNTAFTNGGAFFANNTSSITLNACQFEENAATDGGAVFLNPETTTTIVNSTFSANNASTNGGAIFPNAGATVIVTSTTIQQNTAGGDGGGVFVNNTGSLQLEGSTLTGNTAIGNGGAVYLNGLTDTVITNSTLAGNSSTNGGALFVNVSATLQSTNNTFTSNEANQDGGAVFINFDGISTEQSNEYSGNIAGQRGGAISNFGTFNQIVTNSIGNQLPGQATSGSGVFNGGLNTVNGLVQDPNGLAIAAGENVIQLTGPLFAGSVIQLETTGYVLPDPALSPIIVGIPTTGYPTLMQLDASIFIKPITGFEDWDIRLLNNQIVLVFDPVYTITYRNVRGQINPNPTTYRTSDLPIALQDPGEISGSRFVGWFDVFGDQITIIPVGTTGNLVLFARYLPAPLPSSPIEQLRVRCCMCCKKRYC